jgi:hypothetical protein
MARPPSLLRVSVLGIGHDPGVFRVRLVVLSK